MARIEFTPGHMQKQEVSLKEVTNAAWQFAHTALWHESRFSRAETARVKFQIMTYFTKSGNTEQAFTYFCERIILINRVKFLNKGLSLPQPSVWFNPAYEEGFTESIALHKSVSEGREKVPELWEGISTLAYYYWQYTQKPSAKTVRVCRKKLRAVNEYGLIQLFYNAIIYSQVLYPVRQEAPKGQHMPVIFLSI